MARHLVIAMVLLIAFACAIRAQGGEENLAPAEAQEPIITDRPDFTESPQTVPREFKVQIEGGFTFTRTGATKETALGELLLRVPVAERVELRFGVPNYIFQRAANLSTERASGFEDSFIGAKFALAEGATEPGRLTRPAIGLLVGTSLPTGARVFREENLQPEAILALSTDLTKQVSLSSNVGYVRASDGGEGFNQFLGTLALGIGLSERVGAYIETYGFTRVEASSRRSERYADGGLTFLVNPNFQLDARAGVGLDNNTEGPDYFFGFGFARRF